MGILRFLLALSVIVTHAKILAPFFPLTNNTLVDGEFALQGFFMISGFYMALILTEKYHSLKDFYFNRALRIYPTYWLALIVTTMIALVTGSPTFAERVLHSGWTWGTKLYALFSQLFIWPSDWMYFLFPGPNGLIAVTQHIRPLHTIHENPPIWSLSIELFFYALAPFLVKNRKLLCLVTALSLGIRYLTYIYCGVNDTWMFRFAPSELVFFCSGIFSYHLYKKIQPWGYTGETGFVLFTLLLFYILNFDRIPVFIPDTLLFTGNFMQFQLYLGLALPFIFHATRSNSIDRWIGGLSYPIYVTHWWVLYHTNLLPVICANQYYNVICCTICFSVVIQMFFQSLIEKKFKRQKAD